VASIGQAGGPIPPLDVEDLGPRRCLMLARPSVMAFMNDEKAYRGAAEAVLAALSDGVLKAAGMAYPLSEAARAHADLESGRTSGAIYLKP
jgi:NADPH:quinone reductase